MREVEFATSGGANIAYRAVGTGPPNVMLVPLWFSNLDLLPEFPSIANGLQGFSSFGRVITWDRRGAGLSDRGGGPGTMEQGVEDLLAVLDAAEVEQTALFAFNESAMLAVLAAVKHPERISRLILYGSYATTVRKDDYPWAPTVEERDQQIDFLIQGWGTYQMAQVLIAGGDERAVEWGMRWMRNSVSRDMLVKAYEILAEADVRERLTEIEVPTLVMHRTGDLNVPVQNGRYIASKIPGARYVEFGGSEHVPFLGDWDTIAGEIEEFITGSRRPRGNERVLATIVFTDIVSSTERATELGDTRWRSLLDEYDRATREQTEGHGGRLVKFTGDGSLACFDSPGNAIRSAKGMIAAVKRLGIEIRVGVHTGEVEVRGDDVGGIAVHIGARVMAAAGPSQVLVSPAVPPLVAGSQIAFEDRGPHALKGVEGEWNLYSVG